MTEISPYLDAAARRCRLPLHVFIEGGYVRMHTTPEASERLGQMAMRERRNVVIGGAYAWQDASRAYFDLVRELEAA